MTILMIDVDVDAGPAPCAEAEADDRRGRNPVESAFDTNIVLNNSVVKMRTSMPSTRTWLSVNMDFCWLGTSLLGMVAERPTASCLWETARKCDSHVVASSCLPGGEAYMGATGEGGVDT